MHLASGVELDESIGDVRVVDVERAHSLERRDRPQVVASQVGPQSARLVPRGKSTRSHTTAPGDRFEGIGRPYGIAEKDFLETVKKQMAKKA